MTDTSELLHLATSAATLAGGVLLDGLRQERTSVASKSSLTDMVTEMDRASETTIVRTIRASRPHDSVLAEEGTNAKGSTGVRWVVDPLDGTTNYLYGLPVFAVSIAAEVEGLPSVGVVHDPNHDETFTAVRGSGAWCNGTPLRVEDAGDLSGALVGTGFSYDAERRRDQARVLEALLPEVRDIRRAGAASLDLCWVAASRLDAYFESGLQVWDKAAGQLVASEAGAVVEELRDRPEPRVMTLASSPGIAGPLHGLLSRAIG